jgi:1-acyl-sn-glycerol-3-phosphate acyltransferase
VRVNPYFNPVLYFIGKHGTGLMFNTFWRRRVFGVENIPPQGTAVIFAGNHRSLADPNLIGSAIPYPVNYFAKKELFAVPFIGWYIRRVNAFPVDRVAHDIGAIKMAQKVLEAKEGLVLFPEGGRRRDPKRQWQVKPGVGMLAASTGALVVPVGVRNNINFVKLGRIEVHFGKPLAPPKESTREAYEQFSQVVMDRIKELALGTGGDVHESK